MQHLGLRCARCHRSEAITPCTTSTAAGARSASSLLTAPMEPERAVKTLARERDLLVMGPDCGTAIVNGIPLGFANMVRRGDIGLVAEAGDTHSIVGTEGYLPPEGPGAPQADIFSLGKVLYEINGVPEQLARDKQGVALADVQPAVTSVIEHELALLPDFTRRLARGELPVW